VAIAVVVMAGIAVQTWFRPGTTLAGGDVVLPNGTAWIGRLFAPWTWGGSTLGEPSQLPLAAPWAAILSFVHAFGGDPGLARRVLDTTLFAGAGLAALGLLASLRMAPLPAAVGTAVYLLNPYVITWVNTYDVYLAALLLLPAILAALVAAGTGRLSVRWSAVLVAATAPLIGYTFLNPPLVGMILAATLSAPLVVAWVDGRDAGVRSLRALLLAVPLLLALSAYWIVPVILHLSELHPSPFTGVSGWLFTEVRATIRNAFWLNTHWGWRSPEYFPYAKAYEVPPLALLRFVLPAMAFGALALAPLDDGGHMRFRRHRNLRLAVAATTVALAVIVLSTGTNPPGNRIFDPLFTLPFGWLLQEPARFLMLAALAYAAMVAILVGAIIDHQSVHQLLASRRLTVPAFRLAIVPLAFGTAVLVGFPLYTGALVPDSGPPLPIWAIHARPAHVHVPTYWTEMARFADALPIDGAILVMPPDDFYEMPYTWYYGGDAFIVALFKRRVLVPSAQGYTPASSKLIGAVNLASQSILHRDWHQAEALVRVLNTPLILVRRDIVTPYANHSILSPNDLAAALQAAPNFVLLRQIGSLDLFALGDGVSETEVGSKFSMINTQTPDLRILSMLPPNTALVSGEPAFGVSYVAQAPRLELWQAKGDTFVWQPPAPSGWAYRIADLDSKAVVPLNHAGIVNAPTAKARVLYEPDSATSAITVSVTGRTAISNGDFSKGPWGPVGDCHAVNPAQALQYFDARVLKNTAPGGLPTLQLTASLDSACVHQVIDWHGGPLLLSMMVYHLQGAGPRACLWQTGPNRCAPLPSIPDTGSWSTYRATVRPEAGTAAVTLYLYADAYTQGGPTINDYADVRVVDLPALPDLALLADPEGLSSSSINLVVVHSSFSTKWQGPPNSKHVLVDGILNGWLIPTGANTFSARYNPATALHAAGWISLGACFVILLLPLWSRSLAERFAERIDSLV
jgi:hypothetical protein